MEPEHLSLHETHVLFAPQNALNDGFCQNCDLFSDRYHSRARDACHDVCIHLDFVLYHGLFLWNSAQNRDDLDYVYLKVETNNNQIHLE